MIHAESDNHWAEYLEALNKCCDTVKLMSFHTLDCAEQVEKAATQASLAVYYLREVLKRRQQSHITTG